MCYPCSHCGACKVRLDPQKCPICGGQIEGPGEACPNCGFLMPLSPGVTASDAKERLHDGMVESRKDGAMSEQDILQNANQPKGQNETDDTQIAYDGNVIPCSVEGGYEPEIIAEVDLPLADTFGVVGTWPVAKNRPKL